MALQVYFNPRNVVLAGQGGCQVFTRRQVQVHSATYGF